MSKPTARELILLIGLAALAVFILQHDVVRAQQAAKPQIFSEFRSRLALDGYDPVAYFKTGKPQKGNPAHVLRWNGAAWHFASAENKAAFEASPQAFAPQYGGHCAWAVSEGYTAKGDPNIWRIVDNKLYLNYNASVQKGWEKDIPGRVARGDQNWPIVLNK